MTAQGAWPMPQGNYRAAQRHRDLIFTAGMTPRMNGALQFQGPVRAGDAPEVWREAVEIACGNAPTAARGALAEGEAIGAIVSLSVFIAAEAGFTAHTRLADSASGLLAGELGPAGIGLRAAVGVATLPGNAPVEIQLVAAVAG